VATVLKSSSLLPDVPPRLVYDFDIYRAKTTHLTLSVGPHLCLDHILARAEMRILTEEWFKRIPRFSIKPGARHSFRIGAVQAIESLPIEWANA
jgi:cytochrome P450